MFGEGVSRSQIGKAPAITSFAFPQNCTSVSHLKVSRFVELHDLATERNFQWSSRHRHLNEIRVCSLVCYRFTGTDGPVLRCRFHGNFPISPRCDDRLLTWRILTLCSYVGAAANKLGSWFRHRHCPECGSRRMHSPKRPAMVGAEPNKMRFGKLGTCLAFGHASGRAISQ